MSGMKPEPLTPSGSPATLSNLTIRASGQHWAQSGYGDTLHERLKFRYNIMKDLGGAPVLLPVTVLKSEWGCQEMTAL